MIDNKRPLILISNDDGYEAKGINSLVDMVKDIADIIVCAPEGPRSGKSRAFTMGELKIRPLTDRNCEGQEWWACTGTPVDCIKMAYGSLCPRIPDLVLGGINHGDNASTNAHYSGTIGVVFEGAMKGIPSIAFSICDYNADANFEPMRQLVQRLCKKVLNEGLPHFTCLNVNVPKCNDSSELKGIRISRMADGFWRKEVEQTGTSPDGTPIYELLGYYQSNEPEAEDTDAWALANGYVSITPCTIDITSYDLMKQLESFIV